MAAHNRVRSGHSAQNRVHTHTHMHMHVPDATYPLRHIIHTILWISAH